MAAIPADGPLPRASGPPDDGAPGHDLDSVGIAARRWADMSSEDECTHSLISEGDSSPAEGTLQEDLLCRTHVWSHGDDAQPLSRNSMTPADTCRLRASPGATSATGAGHRNDAAPAGRGVCAILPFRAGGLPHGYSKDIFFSSMEIPLPNNNGPTCGSFYFALATILNMDPWCLQGALCDGTSVFVGPAEVRFCVHRLRKLLPFGLLVLHAPAGAAFHFNYNGKVTKIPVHSALGLQVRYSSLWAVLYKHHHFLPVMTGHESAQSQCLCPYMLSRMRLKAGWQWTGPPLLGA